MTPVSVLSYGVGNLKSVTRAFEAVGADVTLVSDAAGVAAAERLVLPGVGAFSACANGLKDAGLWQPIADYLASDKPFLGICVGMQLMFDASEEFGEHDGFGVVPGRVRRLPDTPGNKIPLVGWKRVTAAPGAPVFDPDTAQDFYFVHSFAGVCADAKDCIATYDYGGAPVTAAVGRGRMIGTQFHPEKSAADGLSLLQRFLAL